MIMGRQAQVGVSCRCILSLWKAACKEDKRYCDSRKPEGVERRMSFLLVNRGRLLRGPFGYCKDLFRTCELLGDKARCVESLALQWAMKQGPPGIRAGIFRHNKS